MPKKPGACVFIERAREGGQEGTEAGSGARRVAGQRLRWGSLAAEGRWVGAQAPLCWAVGWQGGGAAGRQGGGAAGQRGGGTAGGQGRGAAGRLAAGLRGGGAAGLRGCGAAGRRGGGAVRWLGSLEKVR